MWFVIIIEIISFLLEILARGIIYWNKEELEQYWKTKTCLTLKPNSNFVKAESTNKTKKNEFIGLLKKRSGSYLYSLLF